MKRIILIGLSGSGKSAVACELAARLGFTAIDVDDEIIRRSGMPIPAIFERFGEDVFRSFERGCLASACSQEKCVIATGGGAVLDERNWLVMRPESLIVHLQADTNQLLSRLSSQSESDPDALRPLLQASDPKHSLDKMWRERAPFYRQADVSVDTSNKSLDTVAAEILSAITRSRIRLSSFAYWELSAHRTAAPTCMLVRACSIQSANWHVKDSRSLAVRG